MYSEKALSQIRYVENWAKEIASEVYNIADAHDKLLKVDTFDSSIVISLNSLEVNYSLGANEDLLFTANQLLENIDECINFEDIGVDRSDWLTGMSIFRFRCVTTTKITVQIDIDFSQSLSCNVEYEDVTTKKAVLKCA